MNLDDAIMFNAFAARGMVVCALAHIEPNEENVRRALGDLFAPGPAGEVVLAGVCATVASIRQRALELSPPRGGH